MSVDAGAVIRVAFTSRDEAGKLRPPNADVAGLTPTDRHLWEVLAHVADDSGMSWYSVDALAQRMGITAANVRRAARRLQAAGVLDVVSTGGGRGHTNLYRVPVQAQKPARQRAVSAPRNPRGGAQKPARQRAETRAVPRDEVPRSTKKGETAVADDVDTTPEWAAERIGSILARAVARLDETRRLAGSP